ncbi:MAG: FAD:protein FMN transferase, partial [Planctomycetales bacterium]|nr:FAD:protein FMN transferase [Planctomycetales bacterium]
YRNYRRADGQLVTHIVDPRTGSALPYRGMSVTVLSPTCMEADGIATALVVLGDDRAYEWCEEHDVAALFQSVGADGRVVRRATTRYEQLSRPDDSAN